MISLDSPRLSAASSAGAVSPVEVVEPASPPPPAPPSSSHSVASVFSSAVAMSPPPTCASPEIRVTDSPSPPPPPPPVSFPSPPPSTTTATASPAHLLFQPFLSPASSSASSPPPPPPRLQQEAPKRPLPFSIDNILQPSFGQRLFLQSLAAAAAVQQQQLQQQQLQQQQQQQLEQERLKAEKLRIKEEQEKRKKRLSQAKSSPPPPSPSAGSNNNQPVDLSSAKDESGSGSGSPGKDEKDGDCPPGMVRGPNGQLWPAWVFCTRYSDRPSSGPRARKIKKREKAPNPAGTPEEKRPRTAFSADQLARLRREFEENRYLNEERRKTLAADLGLNETQIKIWFQNKRAKLKKSSGEKGDLAKMLAAQGLYNHATVPVDEDEFPNL